MPENKRYEDWERIYAAHGQLDYCLAVFGDTLAKRERYETLDGIDAIHFYLIHKFSWPPSQVREMSSEDIRFVLQEEMHGFVLPEEARV